MGDTDTDQTDDGPPRPRPRGRLRGPGPFHPIEEEPEADDLLAAFHWDDDRWFMTRRR